MSLFFYCNFLRIFLEFGQIMDTSCLVSVLQLLIDFCVYFFTQPVIIHELSLAFF